MKIDEIKELMEAVREAGFTRVKWTRDGEEVELEVGGGMMPLAFAPPQQMATTPPPPAIDAPAAAPAPAASSGTFIESPLVGTFYRAPSPEAEPFVKVGDTVTPDTVVCIVEAMKVMNEVKAGVSGVVKEVLVEGGHPIEFGTKLFRVE